MLYEIIYKRVEQMFRIEATLIAQQRRREILKSRGIFIDDFSETTEDDIKNIQKSEQKTQKNLQTTIKRKKL